MRLRTKTITSCVIQGDDLFIAIVRLGVEITRPNASVVCRLTLPGFLEMDPALRRSELAPALKAAGDSSNVHLTIPSAWCALHPISILINDHAHEIGISQRLNQKLAGVTITADYMKWLFDSADFANKATALDLCAKQRRLH